LQLAEELAGVGRQRLDVAALALSVNGVEGEGTLAGAAGPAANGHLLPRQGDVDVLQVVLLGALNGQVREFSIAIRLAPGCALPPGCHPWTWRPFLQHRL